MTPITHHIIPEDEQYCIWMDAGVVDYKLCNRQFLCEVCSFDAQVRTENRLAAGAESVPAKAAAPAAGSTTEPSRDARQAGARGTVSGAVPAGAGPAAEKIGSSASADEYCAAMMRNFFGAIDRQALPEDRLYSSNHTWAQADDTGHYVLGIDHLIGTLLAPVHSVAFSVPPTHIRAGEPYAWIVANGETLAVRSPIAGTIVENNHALADRSNIIHTDCYTQGWIAKIRPEVGQEVAALKQAHRFAPTLRRDAQSLEHTICTTIRGARPASGATMFDGGAALSTVDDILGTQKIYEILERYLRLRR